MERTRPQRLRLHHQEVGRDADTLFPHAGAQRGGCAARGTIYTSSLSAGLKVHPFRRAPFMPFRETVVEHMQPDSLIIRIQPDEGISLSFEAKRPTISDFFILVPRMSIQARNRVT